MSRFLPRAAAAVLAAAACAWTPVAPASASVCSSASGVSVVVDFHELGGGVQTGCVPAGGGRTVADLLPAAGFALDYVQRQPGFVCRVAGKPADAPCLNTPPADAYWGLWWSDGRSGTWTYASTGAGGLRIPDGGYAAFSWNGSTTRSTPGLTPQAHPSGTPTPTAGATATPTAGPTGTSTSGRSPGSRRPTDASTSTGGTSGTAGPGAAGTAGSTGASPRASTTAAASPHADGDRAGTAVGPTKPHPAVTSPAGESTTEAGVGAASRAHPTAATSDPSDPSGGALPVWVAPTVIVMLFGAGAGTVLARRRRTRQP